MDSQDATRIWVQLKRIADALERVTPPTPKPDSDKPRKRRAVFVL